MKRGMVLGGVLLVLTACTGPESAWPQRLDSQAVELRSPAGVILTERVEIADSEEERSIGLMGRDSVETGMLFIYGKAVPLGFWMKNTLVPLDIMFFDARGAFVSSATMQPCTTPQCPITSSRGAAQYALEMPRGYIAEHGVSSGWTLAIPD